MARHNRKPTETYPRRIEDWPLEVYERKATEALAFLSENAGWTGEKQQRCRREIFTALLTINNKQFRRQDAQRAKAPETRRAAKAVVDATKKLSKLLEQFDVDGEFYTATGALIGQPKDFLALKDIYIRATSAEEAKKEDDDRKELTPAKMKEDVAERALIIFQKYRDPSGKPQRDVAELACILIELPRSENQIKQMTRVIQGLEAWRPFKKKRAKLDQI